MRPSCSTAVDGFWGPWGSKGDGSLVELTGNNVVGRKQIDTSPPLWILPHLRSRPSSRFTVAPAILANLLPENNFLSRSWSFFYFSSLHTRSHNSTSTGEVVVQTFPGGGAQPEAVTHKHKETSVLPLHPSLRQWEDVGSSDYQWCGIHMESEKRRDVCWMKNKQQMANRDPLDTFLWRCCVVYIK